MPPRQVKAWRVSPGQTGRLQSHTLDPLESGQVRVHVHWAAINYKDALSLCGRAPIARHTNLIAGQDLAGVVSESTDPRFARGDVVCAIGGGLGETRHGAFSEYATVAADALMHVPTGWSTRRAAAFGTAGLSAALAIHKIQSTIDLPCELPWLVTGASGGVGMHAVWMLNCLGLPVDILSSKARTAVFSQLQVRAQHHQIPTADGTLAVPRWRAAIDTVGGDVLTQILAQLAPWGSVVALGIAASAQLHTSLMPFVVRGVNLLGLNASGCPMPLKKQLFERWADSALASDGSVIPVTEISLAQALEFSQSMLRNEKTPGRTLLRLV